MPLLEVENVVKTFRRGGGPAVRAVDDVSFSIEAGQTMTLIGESGSGKSTVARIVLGLERPDSGRVVFDGQDLTAMSPRDLRAKRSTLTAVFQEPYESLNPRMKVESIVGEPLKLFDRTLSKAARRDRVVASLEEVGLGAGILRRYPGDLSGGQQQRLGIARALILSPRLIVLDEPTSSLDLTVRATILTLLKELQLRHSLTYLFISHDIATVRYFSTNTGVMYLGRFVERGPTEEIIDDPRHPYSVALLSSTLSTDPGEMKPARPLTGDAPSPTTRFPGCPLVGRCPVQVDECATRPVPMTSITPTRSAACIRVRPGTAGPERNEAPS
ncbi:oligopeptide/dipeptide ABC transporter ATP-binding protein [Rhizohabitans arisaemae]|uniref:oligopeptide/dipeptide ABC transporter ATP-binding protein n=1 Tax=Rhizohabitans arisaemae TaxID=2720610 RepID=UPI0024B2383C|nr:ABC transporter ATP-binding protein [Rhizohabitans arisaemae]